VYISADHIVWTAGRLHVRWVGSVTSATQMTWKYSIWKKIAKITESTYSLTVIGPPFSIKGGHMLHCCLSVCRLLQPGTVLKRCNIAGWNSTGWQGRVLALTMPNGIQKDGTVFEQWRLQWGYPPFRVDEDRLNGHIFGSIARRKHRRAKIMAPYYRQLFTANPTVLTRCPWMTLKGLFQGHESENRQYLLNGCS